MFSYTRDFGDVPCHFEPWSSDENDTSSPNFHTPPMGGSLNVYMFNIHQLPLHGESSVVLGSNSGHIGHDFVTLTTRLPWPLFITK
ncbi:hypothetical protein TNCV_4062811 [Trichonephila clavipes]|nr:hypothetical protein TNCV_4062811 [Trichonephila clavipes]